MTEVCASHASASRKLLQASGKQNKLKRSCSWWLQGFHGGAIGLRWYISTCLKLAMLMHRVRANKKLLSCSRFFPSSGLVAPTMLDCSLQTFGLQGLDPILNTLHYMHYTIHYIMLYGYICYMATHISIYIMLHTIQHTSIAASPLPLHLVADSSQPMGSRV